MLWVFVEAAAGLPASSTRHYLACVRTGQGVRRNNDAQAREKIRAKSTAWLRARENDEKPKKNHTPICTFSRVPNPLILHGFFQFSDACA